MSAAPLLELMMDYPEGVPVEVCHYFERVAMDLIAMKFARYSADAILHRCRWHWQVERGDRGFKINNNWSAALARWFLKHHPEAKGFFELRERVDA